MSDLLKPQPSTFEDEGDTPPVVAAQLDWLQAQSHTNIDRLQSAAQTVIQLVTGLYGVLLAILALDENPVYLLDGRIRLLASGTLLLFFIALTAAFYTLNPRSYRFQQGKTAEMQAAYALILERKQSGVTVAGAAFLLGMLLLGGMILLILWM